MSNSQIIIPNNWAKKITLGFLLELSGLYKNRFLRLALTQYIGPKTPQRPYKP
jgi:hypothetical protein